MLSPICEWTGSQPQETLTQHRKEELRWLTPLALSALTLDSGSNKEKPKKSQRSMEISEVQSQ